MIIRDPCTRVLSCVQSYPIIKMNVISILWSLWHEKRSIHLPVSESCPDFILHIILHSILLAIKKLETKVSSFLLVRIKGFEPPWSNPHTDLNRARLPIPPYPHIQATFLLYYVLELMQVLFENFFEIFMEIFLCNHYASDNFYSGVFSKHEMYKNHACSGCFVTVHCTFFNYFQCIS